jgi:hypothetical protein
MLRRFLFTGRQSSSTKVMPTSSIFTQKWNAHRCRSADQATSRVLQRASEDLEAFEDACQVRHGRERSRGNGRANLVSVPTLTPHLSSLNHRRSDTMTLDTYDSKPHADSSLIPLLASA